MNTKQTQSNRSGGRELSGTVGSVGMNSTVIVKVVHVTRHPLYKKALKRTKKYAAHVENMDLSVGDKVIIKETKPISKTKHFRVISKI